jgi:hypothetical protein
MPVLSSQKLFVGEVSLYTTFGMASQLYVFDKFERRSYRTQVGNIANERYFYDFPQDDNSDSDGISDADVQITFKYKGVVTPWNWTPGKVKARRYTRTKKGVHDDTTTNIYS